MKIKMVQKSKSVAQIIRDRRVVAEVRAVSDGFKLIQNGESLGVFGSQQAAWDHFIQPVKERNREVAAHNRQVRAEWERKCRELDRKMAESSDPNEREMARLMGKIDELNRVLEGK